MSVFGDADRRKELGKALRTLRQNAGLTGMQLAAELGIGQATVSRWETGRKFPSPEQIDQWAIVTGATTQQRVELDQLAEAAATEAIAWRRRPLAAMQQDTADLEATSGLIRGFHPILVHGLLQIPGYAQAIYQARAQLFGQTDAEVAEAVATRMNKQALLYQPSHRFGFLMTEAGLRWRFVPPGIMAAQFDRLTQAARMPNVLVGIIPAEVEAPVWGWTGFAAFLERVGGVEDLIVVETLTAGLTVRNPVDVARYAAAFQRLLEVAVTGDEAVAMLERIAAELR